MRAPFACFLAILLLAVGVLAWDKDDYEIFDLVRDLKADGATTGPPIARDTLPQITKAYRKRSLELHPDKNPGVKGIQERFARLGVITAILRNPERRERYNFFYKNGVPTWKGFGYAYTRWRPSLAHVLVFLVILTAGLGYVVQLLNYSRDTKRVAYFTEAARRAARGTTAGRRKVRVPMIEGSVGGEQLELVVENGHVYLPHDDGSLWPLSELAPAPSIKRTWPVVLARKLVARVTGKSTKDHHHDEHAADVHAGDYDDNDDDVLDIDQVEGFSIDSSSVNAPKGSRAAQLREQRKKKTNKASREGSASGTATGTEGEGDASESAVSGVETEEKKKRRPGPGKAAGARRRKMGMK